MTEALLERFLDRLEEGRARQNLTGLRTREAMRVQLVEDALAGRLVLDPVMPASVLDLGCGAGVPGLVLAVAYPDSRFTLVDAAGRKTVFVAETARALGLSNVTVRTGRAEELARDAELRETFDVVTAKALAELPVLVELAVPYLRPGGMLVAWKGPAADEELAAAGRMLEALEARVERVADYRLDPANRRRCLVVIRRVGALSDRYPRRPNRWGQPPRNRGQSTE